MIPRLGGVSAPSEAPWTTYESCSRNAFREHDSSPVGNAFLLLRCSQRAPETARISWRPPKIPRKRSNKRMNSQNAPNELLRPPKHPKRLQEASQQGPQRSTVDFLFLLRCFFWPSCAFGSTTLQYCPTNSPNRSTTVQETPEKAPKRTNRALETAQNLPGALTIAPRRPSNTRTDTSNVHLHTPPPPPQAAPRAPQAPRKAPRKPQEPPKRHSNTPNLDRARARMASRTTAVDGPCQRHESSETAYRCQGSSKTAREHAKRVYRLPQIPSQSCSRKAAPERDSRLQARPGAVLAPFGALDRPCKSLLRNAVRAHHSSPSTRRSDITAAPCIGYFIHFCYVTQTAFRSFRNHSYHIPGPTPGNIVPRCFAPRPPSNERASEP